MEEGTRGSQGAAKETLRTAELDNRGILQLQETAMAQQDAELEQLERSVTSTKVRATFWHSAAHAGPHSSAEAAGQCGSRGMDGTGSRCASGMDTF